MSIVAALAFAIAGQTPRERIAKLAADYGIEIKVLTSIQRTSRFDYFVTAQPPTEEQLAKYLPFFEIEWRRYPVSLMARVKLKRMIIGAKVQVEGQPRAVVPEFAPGWFWLDAEVGSRLPEYGRLAMHHDFFHMIDDAIRPGRQDRAWAALNGPNVRYGIGGWWMQKGGAGAMRKDLPGFLTAYSTSAVEEDKAEVFSHLIGTSAFVEERMAADPVIKAKVERLKQLVVTFEPAMDESWWRANRFPG